MKHLNESEHEWYNHIRKGTREKYNFLAPGAVARSRLNDMR